MKTTTTITIERDETELDVTVTADVSPAEFENESDDVNSEIKATCEGEPIALTEDEEETAIDALMEKARELMDDPWADVPWEDLDREPDYDLYDE